MGHRMTQAPVYFTLVQARFNPITALDSYVQRIQDRLRLKGFPDFQQGVLPIINFNMGNPNEPRPSQVPVSLLARYSFSNMNKTAGFVLDQGSLLFQTTDYDVFKSFSNQFLNGLKIVDEAVKLSYTDRIRRAIS